MVDWLVLAFWAFLPAGLANMAPIFASKLTVLKFLDIPIDAGKKFRGKRIFGDNKTVRGFLAGFVFAFIGVLLQRKYFIDCTQCTVEFKHFEYINRVLLALYFSVGALGGDAIESFFKRQFNKKPGSTWFPFDQLDYIIGGLLLTWPVMDYSPTLALVIVGLFFGLHIVSTVVGYLLGLKAKPI